MQILDCQKLKKKILMKYSKNLWNLVKLVSKLIRSSSRKDQQKVCILQYLIFFSKTI